MANSDIKHSINGHCDISYVFIFLVTAFYISLSKIVGEINVDPLNKANNPKIAICYFLAFHTQCSKFVGVELS